MQVRSSIHQLSASVSVTDSSQCQSAIVQLMHRPAFGACWNRNTHVIFFWLGSSHWFMINLRFMCLNHGPFIYLSDSCHIYWTNRLILKAIQLTLDRQQSKNKFFFLYFWNSILLNWKGRNLYVLVEFIFLAVMGRLAAGRDLTFKVQNTRSNKLAFQPKLSFHLRTY